TWKSLNIVEPNGLIQLKKKLQALKIAIKAWSKEANKRSNDSEINIQQNLSEVDKLIDQGKNQVQDFERTVTYEEVKRAVWDYGTNKSPGPDGFSFEFYRKYWTTIDDDVFQAVFFVNGHFPRGWIGVSSNVVAVAASLIGCSILTAPFNYLGMKVGSNMSRITSWDDVIFKVPIGVLNHLESIRQNFFYGVDGSDRKLAWIG
nr:RNA-directed DNA polymerase, eukaryota [Tanacetum cinerariifolium]